MKSGNRFLGIIGLILLGVILWQGCQSTASSRRSTPSQIDTGYGDADTELAGIETLPKDLGKKSKKDRRVAYAVGPDDVLKVEVRQHPEVGGEFQVSPEGTIFISLIGSVEVEDATTEEIGQRVEERLAEFIREPEVAVSVLQYNSKKIYVLGQVQRPNEYPMKGNTLSVRDALFLAGLPRDTANIHHVAVITPDEDNPQVILINLNDILYRGVMRHNIDLKPGDVVVIHRHLLAKLGALLDQVVGPTTRVRALENTVRAFQ